MTQISLRSHLIDVARWRGLGICETVPNISMQSESRLFAKVQRQTAKNKNVKIPPKQSPTSSVIWNFSMHYFKSLSILKWSKHELMAWGCSSVGRASDRHAADAGSNPCQLAVQTLLRCPYTPVRNSIACIYICTHVKDPVVNVRVRWTMEILQHPACTLGWIARLCRRWLSPGKATRISHGRNPIGTIQ